MIKKIQLHYNILPLREQEAHISLKTVAELYLSERVQRLNTPESEIMSWRVYEHHHDESITHLIADVVVNIISEDLWLNFIAALASKQGPTLFVIDEVERFDVA